MLFRTIGSQMKTSSDGRGFVGESQEILTGNFWGAWAPREVIELTTALFRSYNRTSSISVNDWTATGFLSPLPCLWLASDIDAISECHRSLLARSLVHPTKVKRRDCNQYYDNGQNYLWLALLDEINDFWYHIVIENNTAYSWSDLSILADFLANRTPEHYGTYKSQRHNKAR